MHMVSKEVRGGTGGGCGRLKARLMTKAQSDYNLTPNTLPVLLPSASLSRILLCPLAVPSTCPGLFYP